MTKIEWTEATWNPIVGCSIVSPGCTNCYAMKMAARIERMSPGLEHYRGLTQPSKAGAVWTGKVARAPDRTLLEPLRRKRPTMYFVNSMSDLFHEDVTDEWIDRILAVMALCPQHTFQVLTKRAKRMRTYFEGQRARREALGELMFEVGGEQRQGWYAPEYDGKRAWMGICVPLPNVWLGVSAERQKEADERIPELLATPAAVRFVSAEPMLGHINLVQSLNVKPWTATDRNGLGLSWIIVGGESGPGARPMHPDWARSIRDQCIATDVPFFFKQWGAWRQVTDADTYDTSKGRAGRPPAFIVAHNGTVHCFKNVGYAIDRDHPPVTMIEVGKARAGRLLDGREWNEMPGASKYDQALTDPHHGGKIPA